MSSSIAASRSEAAFLLPGLEIASEVFLLALRHLVPAR